MREPTKQERADAIQWFREHCPKGSTVYTILRHVSSSGMLRRIGLVVIAPNRPRKPGQDRFVILSPDFAGSVIWQSGGNGPEVVQ